MIGATLFSGGRGVELLLRDAIDFRYAVEFDPAIAAAGAQLGGHTIVADVRDVDYTAWGALDYLHASPVCKNASQAKTDGVETDTDIETAMAVVRCIEATQPRVVTIENVWGYRTFEAFRRICQALDRGGYMWHFEHLNAADFGVPQTRRRLILRAVRGALLPGWPEPKPWVGWYAAIEDLIPTLPESQFAPWQLARLGAAELKGMEIEETFFVGGANKSQSFLDFAVENRPSIPGIRNGSEPIMLVPSDAATNYAGRAFIVSNSATEYSDGIRGADEPMLSITTQVGGRARAWLVNEDSKMGLYSEDEPAPTQVSSAASHNSHFPDTKPKAWLARGRVVKMTPRALARFQSVPDWYELPSKASLACTVIGNMAPPLLMREVVQPLL